MDITWLGYGCFRLKGRHVSVVNDPFDRSVGLSLARESADIVTVSSDRPEFNNRGAISGSPRVIDGPGEYEIADTLIIGVQTYRDDARGRERGRNTAYAIEIDDVVIAHLGSIGHLVNEAQLEALGNVDVLLLPVGGHGALDAARAAETVALVDPSLVIPMMYATEGLELPAEPVDRFLKEMGITAPNVQPKVTVTKSTLPETVQVAVLEPKGG